MYPPLPGARAEAIAVAARLTGGPSGVDAARVRALTSGNDDARNIINALFERPYRIVHVAGHGAPGPDGGVVLSGGTYLGAAEVKAMRTVPELVFLNCCHLAGRDAQVGARAVRPRRVRGQHRRSADRDRRALRHRRRLGGRRQAGRDVRDHLLRRAARRRPLHRRRRRRAQRRLAARRRRQHLVGLPVLRRSRLDLAARRRRRAARAGAGRPTSSPASRRRRR